MANYVKCPKGHYYDPALTNTCPQCAAEAAAASGRNQIFGDATQPVDNIGETMPTGNSGAVDYGATEAVSMPGYGGAGIPPTEPVNPPAGGGFSHGGGYSNNTFSWNGETEPSTSPIDGSNFPNDNRFRMNDWDDSGPVPTPAPKVQDYDPTMPATLNGVPGFSPVTGWLVCIDGPAKGTDYRIHTDYNFIGRASNMDISIAGDNRIDRDRHAVVVYDPQERIFFFGPQNAKSVVRVNNRPVIGQVELNPYDVLTIGTTKLMFVPLCGKEFNWDA